MIYWRCYIEAYERHTADLSLAEDGAYTRLLRWYFLKEQPLPKDTEKCMRIARATTPDERDAVCIVLNTYFDLLEDGYHNDRADHEIEVSKKARENGSRGGRPSASESARSDSAETDTRTGSITGSQTERQTETITGSGTGSGHPFSRSAFQPNNPSTALPVQPSTQDQNHSADAPRRGARKPSVDSRDTWAAYSGAYLERYGTEPVRNARVNGQIASLIRGIGEAESPQVAAFYVRHNRALYVQSKHSTNLLARDAEGLRTEWATNRAVSETEARQSDRTMATGNAFAPLIEQARKALA